MVLELWDMERKAQSGLTVFFLPPSAEEPRSLHIPARISCLPSRAALLSKRVVVEMTVKERPKGLDMVG